MKYDVVIIGAGVTGAAIALELSKYQLRVLVLEKENDVSMHTSKANSAIIHAGYDPLFGTKMARMNVLGSKMVKELAEKLHFHYKQIGSLVIGRKDVDKLLIDRLYQRGIDNGVEGLRLLTTRKEILELGEENLSEDIDYALYAPSAAIVSPWEMTLAFMTNAVFNGVELKLNSEVEKIERLPHGFFIETSSGAYESDYVINAAGLHGDDVYAMALGRRAFDIVPVKGEYYLLDKDQGSLVRHVIFQTPSKVGKGVLVSPTVHGNLIVGPNAQTVKEKDKVDVTASGLKEVREKACLTTGKINFFGNVRNFAGNRATIPGVDDFLIEESTEVPGFINFVGIKSPGLSSSPAFGLEAVRLLTDAGLKFKIKEHYHYMPLHPFFKEMSLQEKEEKLKKNPLYGRVICRCESITEGEIVDAIHSEIPATTIDAVKRRCNAGMGRCQGGFCSPKVFEILMRELNLPFDKVYQDREGSQVVVKETKEER